MLATSRAQPLGGGAAGAAPIDYLVCPAERLQVPDAAYDVVLCQQGLPLIPDRRAALAEMWRALRTGGRVGVAVWAAEHPLGVFGPLIEAVAPFLPEPYPYAFDTQSSAMTAAQLQQVMVSAGFPSALVATQQVTVVFDSLESATRIILGTPFAPGFTAQPEARQAEVRQALAAAFSRFVVDGHVHCPTVAHIGRATRR